jgi:CubicO group peptidase (beta-lactamase class C family)
MKVKHYLSIFLFVISANALVAQSSIDQQVDELLAKAYPTNEPGAAVLVVKDNKVILKKGYGLANLNPSKPVTPEMIFRIGSITKQFTSTAILKLAEQGKLDLKANITKYIPDFNTQGKVVTIEELLDHTSGIKSYTSLPDVMAVEKKGLFVSTTDMLKTIQSQPFDFEPRSQWLYNNSGYFLLGVIIEKVSGVSYNEYVTKNLFKPAGMKSSYVDDPKLPYGFTTGYAKANDTEYKVADYVHTSIPFSAGSIFSTVEDLWKWNQAVFNYKLIKKESLERAWEPATLTNGSKVSYGYGWSITRVGDSKAIGHGGGIDGFLSYEVYVPDLKLYVCILSNNTSKSPDEQAYRVAELVAGINRQSPSAIQLDEPTAQEYIGVYKISNTEDRVITKKGSQFYSQRTGGNKFEIFPYAKDAFYFKDSPSRLKFIRNTEGKIESAEMKGREYVAQVATRTNKPLPVDRVEIALDNAIFDRYVGEYELAPGFIIKVWREENKFRTQATGQQPIDIFAESETKFFLKVIDAQLEFKQDDEGNVSELVLFQGGRQMLGKKIK